MENVGLDRFSLCPIVFVAENGDYVFTCVCLSVCLSVCLLICSCPSSTNSIITGLLKNYLTNLYETLWNVGHNLRANGIDFE